MKYRNHTLSLLSRSYAFLMLLFIPLLPALSGAVVKSGADAKIVYSGRVEKWNDASSPDGKRIIMRWSGTTAKIKFQGTTSIQLRMKSNASNMHLSFILDGVLLTKNSTLNPPVWIVKMNGQNTKDITVTTGLSTGVHTLEVFSCVDTQSWRETWIQRITMDDGATLLQADPLPNRRVEFYGDSVTIGGSPLAKKANPTNNDNDWTGHNYYNYVGQTARALNLDHRIIAKGGMGLKYGFNPTGFLEFTWNKRRLRNEAPEYDTTSWVPKVVVLAIGQNDQFNVPPVPRNFERPFYENTLLSGISASDQSLLNSFYKLNSNDYYILEKNGEWVVSPGQELTAAERDSINAIMSSKGITHHTEYRRAYALLVKRFFSTYPGVNVICMNTTMTNPGFLNATYDQIRADSTLGPKVGNTLFLKSFPQQGFGAHPHMDQHTQMADSLVQWIENATGWSAGGSSGSSSSSSGGASSIELGMKYKTR